MRIVVLIKQILDESGVTVRQDKERIFINQEAYIISPGDKNGLEAALQIKDAEPEREVVVVSLGFPRANDALREALAMGADRAYLLSDPLFETCDLAGRARVLAAAVAKLDADLVIAGREAGDAAAGQIGPRVAEILDITQVTDVHFVKVQDASVTATRRWGKGYAMVQTSLPALISIAPGTNRPRYAHGARIMNAYRSWEVPVWGAAELGLEEEDLTPLVVFQVQSFPPPLEVGEILKGDAEDIANELVMILRTQKLIER